MSLEVEANGPSSRDTATRPKCLIKDISQGSSSSSGSTEKSDMSAQDELGTTVNGLSSMDQNQNCTAAAEVVAASFEAACEDDPSRSITEGAGGGPSEEELLRQLEEANRLLEADEKSYIARAAFSATPGHSRKGSESSIVSSTSSNSFYSHQNSNRADDSNEDSEPGESPPVPGRQARRSRKALTPLLKLKLRMLESGRDPSPGDGVSMPPAQMKRSSLSDRSDAAAEGATVSSKANFQYSHFFHGYPARPLLPWQPRKATSSMASQQTHLFHGNPAHPLVPWQTSKPNSSMATQQGHLFHGHPARPLIPWPPSKATYSMATQQGHLFHGHPAGPLAPWPPSKPTSSMATQQGHLLQGHPANPLVPWPPGRATSSMASLDLPPTVVFASLPLL